MAASVTCLLRPFQIELVISVAADRLTTIKLSFFEAAPSKLLPVIQWRLSGRSTPYAVTDLRRARPGGAGESGHSSEASRNPSRNPVWCGTILASRDRIRP